MKLNEIAIFHHQWLGMKGWNNTTPLESAGMIGSEIGEATRECFGNNMTPHFKEEVADIVLRIIGLTQRYNVDIEKGLVDQSNEWNSWVNDSKWGQGSILEDLSLMNGLLSFLINECRGEKIGDRFTQTSMNLLLSVESLSIKCGFNLLEEVNKKIEKNKSKINNRLK